MHWGGHRGVVRFACSLFVKTCFSRSVMDSHCWREAASVPLRRLVFLGFANGKNRFFELVGVVAVARWMFAGTASLVPGKKYFGSWLSSFHGICVSAVSVCTDIIASLFGCDFEETFHVRVAPHRENICRGLCAIMMSAKNSGPVCHRNRRKQSSKTHSNLKQQIKDKMKVLFFTFCFTCLFETHTLALPFQFGWIYHKSYMIFCREFVVSSDFDW